MMKEVNSLEVVIIGGSYAGLSAAMTLGRALRQVLVIDDGKPCNAQTPHSHNFLTQDGESPAAIAKKAKEQVMAYPSVSFLDDRATGLRKDGNLFELSTASGKLFSAKKILFATGIRDLMPAITGFAACWGISVLHCPYCHGYEVKGEKTALLANGEIAVHMTAMLSNWTKDLTLFSNGSNKLNEEQLKQVKQRGIEVIETPVAEVIHNNGQLESIILQDGTRHLFKVMYAKLPFEQQTGLLEELGCQFNEQGYVVVDEMKKTSIEGVYAAGDNITMARSVAAAVAAGTFSGAAINHALII